MQATLSYRHRVITDAELDFIRRLIAENPQCSRRRLSEKLCRAWNWVQPNGALRDMVCRGLMLMLHRQGLIELPPLRQVGRSSLLRRDKPAAVNGLLQQHHYLGYTQPVGEHLKYLVFARGRPIACVAWSSAPRHLGSRDRFIGWSAQARLKNIALLAYNTRFLILPWVRVPHLASHILGRMARTLSADWLHLYAHPILFVETFIDPQRFAGTCYRAANWIPIGVTTGRGKDDQTHRANRPIKQVLGYPLVKDFRQRLSRLPQAPGEAAVQALA
jgi:Domain of unknown function (DUF4338)